MSEPGPGPSAALRRRAGRAGGALVDQVLSSGSGLLLFVLVAREADPATFGALSVAVIVHGFLLGVVRAAVGDVVLLRCRRPDAHARPEAAVGLFLAGAAGLAATAGLLLVGAALGGTVGELLAIVALAAPFVYAQDLLRSVAYGAGRVHDAIALDGTWLGVQAVASAALLAAGAASPTALMLAWAAGAVASAVGGSLLARLRPRRASLARWWREERARAAGFVGDFLVSTGLVQAAFLLLGAVLPLDEFGALRVAFVSLSPLANLLAGVRTMTLAHLAGLRPHPLGARRRSGELSVAFAAAGAVYGAVLVAVPTAWGGQVFGESWAAAAELVGIVAVGEALRLGTFSAIDLVKVLGSPLDLVRTRAAATTGVVAGLLAGAATGGPRGAAVLAAAGYALAAVLWWRRATMVAMAVAQQVPTARS
ncbi:MAG: hypothetical protein ACLGI8_05480 [Acidimicrobiia bacterium]